MDGPCESRGELDDLVGGLRGLPDGEAVALPPACGDGAALAEGAGVDGVVGADDAEESALWGA